MIRNYDDFVSELLTTGFSEMGGGSPVVYSVMRHGWGDAPSGGPIRWFTGDPDTDPWEWRMRVLKERSDVAYAKLFFRKAGYVTEEWYPYFYAARRQNKSLADEYYNGNVSSLAKRVYDAISSCGGSPAHEVKKIAANSGDERKKIDGALIELQMKMYITISGSRQKLTKTGEEYGWSSSVFKTAEDFFPSRVFEHAARLRAADAAEKIERRIYELDPSAEPKIVEKFIKG